MALFVGKTSEGPLPILRTGGRKLGLCAPLPQFGATGPGGRFRCVGRTGAAQPPQAALVDSVGRLVSHT